MMATGAVKHGGMKGGHPLRFFSSELPHSFPLCTFGSSILPDSSAFHAYSITQAELHFEGLEARIGKLPKEWS